MRAFSLAVTSHVYSLVVVCGLLTVLVFPAVKHGLWGAGASAVEALRLSSCSSQTLGHRLIAVAVRLSCPEAYAILPDRGSNQCLLYRQVDSLPLSHQGSSTKQF